MMNWRLISLLLFSYSAFGQCHLFELKGRVKLDGNDFVLIVNEGTGSELKFHATKSNEKDLGVMLNHFISGSFILKERNPVSGSELLSIKDVKPSVPDPLNHDDEFAYRGQRNCPKFSNKQH